MTALEFAIKHGFDNVRRIPSWRGHDCYEAYYGDGFEVQCVGLPQIIFADEERMATYEETLQYMDEIGDADGNGMED